MYLKYIKYYYLGLTFFALVAPVTVGYSDLFPAIVLTWFIFFVFYFASQSHRNNIFNIIEIDPLINDRFLKTNFLITCFALVFVPLYIQFYTGSDIITGITKFIALDSVGADSTYQSYQRYFEDANIKEFTLEKLPYILGAGILKFLYWAMVIRTIAFKKKPGKFQLLCVFIVTLLYVFTGMSRGTSYENFEIVMLGIFTLLLREKIIHKRNWFGKKALTIIVSTIFAGGFYFLLSASLRSADSSTFKFLSISKEMQFDPKSLVNQYFPALGTVFMNFSGYFIFGLFFTSFSINSVWLTSVDGFLSILLPGGMSLLKNEDSYRDYLCGNQIDCGALWIPDNIVMINDYGLILFIILIYVLGRASTRLYKNLGSGSISAALVLYVIVLFFFSLPVGNFITASSSIIISITLLIIVHYFRTPPFIANYFKVDK